MMLQTEIEFLKGVGPVRGELLRKELGIFTFGDLLQHYPFRYVDRSRYYSISEIKSDAAYVQIKGKLGEVMLEGEGRKKRLVASFSDGTASMELIWFQGYKWIMQSLKQGAEYIVFGKPVEFKGKFSIVHPEMDLASDFKPQDQVAFQPVYPTTEKLKVRGLDSKQLGKLIRTLISQPNFKVAEILPGQIKVAESLLEREAAIRLIHFPKNMEDVELARRRLKFEELLLLQLRLLRIKGLRKEKNAGYVFEKIGQYFNSFFNNHLPFELTDAQKRVLKEIRLDMKTGRQMNRLLQGDVGSGKTVVALMSMLMALDNDCQACLMAPTEILAQQHYNGISELLAKMDITIRLLTGSTSQRERKILLSQLAAGEIQIIIGTHALLEDKVVFKKLGIAIIDEQHRFGVEQRARLWKKSTIFPHVLVMTATPIPRTLAMTVYGDLDMSVIDELPAGRKPIKTIRQTEEDRPKVFQFMHKQINEGRQIYVVYPLLEESEKMDLKNLSAGYDHIELNFPPPKFKIVMMHGRLPQEDKDLGMRLFLENKSQIMVATTVIEVGVNVPNASVMVIENAERFGLSQLHQLRGRVGRGADQSYCILITKGKLGPEARQRIETMCRTNDGFEIADMDLKLRGPGDLQGTQQSGVLELKLADLGKDQAVLLSARYHASALLEKDPGLTLPENQALSQVLLQHSKASIWSRIS